MPLTLSNHEATSIQVVTLVGEIDIETSGDFSGYMESILGDSTAHVVLDMNDVVFVDSTGLGALVLLRNRVRLRDGYLVLAGVDPVVLRTMSVSGLDLVFQIVENLETALVLVNDAAAQ